MAKMPASKMLTIPVPHWADDGECRNIDPEYFFDDHDTEADFPNPTAYLACSRCMIQSQCLQWALDTDEKHGVWGGMTRRQRLKVRRPIMRVRCPGCSSNALLEEPTSETCLSCGLTWKI
jgi:WhiB family redox-sensing transcriptional regulator